MEEATASAVGWIVGSHVALTTTYGQILKGEIFTYDKASGIVVLRAPAKDNRFKLQFLSEKHIQELLQVDVSSSVTTVEELPSLNLAGLKIAAEKKYEAAKLKASQIGIGVTPEGQKLFDALARTLECRWSGTTIVCMNEVTIKPPYDVENVAAVGKDDHQMCIRIQQMVSEERSRWSDQLANKK